MKLKVLTTLSIISIILGGFGAFVYIFFVVSFPIEVYVPIGVLILLLITLGILGLKRRNQILESMKPVYVLKEYSENVIEGYSLLLESVDSFPENEKCRITKLDLTEEREVVRCPHCKSLFIKEYVIDWIKGSKLCPICNSLLVSLIIDEKTVNAIPKTVVF